MKMAANETELRNALKEKTQEITIVTSYADKVMNRYKAELTTKNQLQHDCHASALEVGACELPEIL